jgi:GNAT superfamily N-acetyltransferase
MDNWHMFLELFGEKGACGSCWCMFYRLSNSDFKEGKKNYGNRESMKKLVRQKKPAGILAISKDHAIAWCAFALRQDFIRLENSRVHKRIDDKEVWSIPCFFIHKDYRRKGVSVEILKGIISYARKNRKKIIEAYPQIPTQEKYPDSFLWIGLYKSFERAGFQIVDRKSKNRPMVRFYTMNNEQ